MFAVLADFIVDNGVGVAVVAIDAVIAVNVVVAVAVAVVIDTGVPVVVHVYT